MIKAKNLTFRYPDANNDALKGIDLLLQKGDFGILEAPGGAGKSTFIKLLLGVYRPTDGELEVNGADLNQLRHTAQLRRSIGVVSEQVDLITDRSVAENVLLPLELTGGARSSSQRRLLETLHRFGLDSLKNEFPASLSEGERRRAKLARALVNEPVLLILDEPTLALDPATATALWDLLFREHQRGMTILAAVSSVPSEPRFDGLPRFGLVKG